MTKHATPTAALARPASPLEEVRRLEAAAEQRRHADQQATARLARARRDAEATVATARTRGEEQATVRRAALLAAADRDAERILAEGHGLAAGVQHQVEQRLPELVTEALRCILPAASGPSSGQAASEGR
jgi:flagellar biosynthesis/type III secretory pathway protein FliH